MKIFKSFFDNKVKIYKSNIFSDARGFFTEQYNIKKLAKINIKEKFVQDNFVFSSKKNTFRGIHLQKKPFQQSKIIYVISGEILDVVVDLRKNSKTFGKYKLIKLNDKNRLQIYIPKNFGHAYLTLKNNTIVNYKVSNYYSPNQSICISYLDPMINLQLSIKKIILSKNDKNGLFIKDIMDKL